MLHSLKLLLPALIPAWNFFDVIAPSPRVQFVTLNRATDQSESWQAFRPRPSSLSFIQMLGRMLWNPHWNETLFVMSCAERLIEYPTQHSEHQILQRIATELLTNDSGVIDQYIRFRLLTVMRKGDTFELEEVYTSATASIVELTNP